MKKRNVEKFLINNIVTERYKRSSIPVMKKMLNEEDLRLKEPCKALILSPENIVILTLSLRK